jgi:hypothetical protein
VVDKGWTETKNLTTDDIFVDQSRKNLLITSIESEFFKNPITVYNFEVEEHHDYYVSAVKVLVHNAKCGNKPKYVVENRVPKDHETVLNGAEYKRTAKREKGATIYKKDKRHFHRDTLHEGKSAHIEVYNKTGKKHLGEMNPTSGQINYQKADPTKSIKL